MKKNSSKKCSGVKRFIGRLMLIITACCAVAAAIMKILDLLKSKKANSANPDRDFKEYFNFLGLKNTALSDSDVAGVISKNICASTELDLSDAQFRKDAFISLEAHCSIISIIIPDGVNVKVDGLITASSVHNEAEAIDPSLPTLYIASRLALSSVRIARKD